MFGITVSPNNFSTSESLKMRLKTNGFDYYDYVGNIIVLKKPLSLEGTVKLPSDDKTVVFYLNGISVTNQFEITQNGKYLTFKYCNHMQYFNSDVVFKLELINK